MVAAHLVSSISCKQYPLILFPIFLTRDSALHTQQCFSLPRNLLPGILIHHSPQSVLKRLVRRLFARSRFLSIPVLSLGCQICQSQRRCLSEAPVIRNGWKPGLCGSDTRGAGRIGAVLVRRLEWVDAPPFGGFGRSEEVVFWQQCWSLCLKTACFYISGVLESVLG